MSSLERVGLAGPNLKEKTRHDINLYWENPNLLISYQGELLTLKAIYKRELEKSNETFRHMHKLSHEAIPQGTYVLFVNATKGGVLEHPDFPLINEERRKMMFLTDTGRESVKPEELLDETVRRSLGIDHKDDRFRTTHLFDDTSPYMIDENCVGIVFSGSEINVYDTDEKHAEQFAAAQALVKQAMQKDLPMFGICFGSQLIAHKLGAKVSWIMDENGEQQRVFGIQTITPFETDSLFGITPNTKFSVAQNHGQSIDPDTLAKSGGTVLASSKFGVEIYEVPRQNILATQFHPEVTGLKADIAFSLNPDSNIGPTQIFKGDMNATREKLFSGFLERVKRHNNETRTNEV
jgi:GMP synthase-like glutamine amidotransferase